MAPTWAAARLKLTKRNRKEKEAKALVAAAIIAESDSGSNQAFLYPYLKRLGFFEVP
jgi:hypothetical protein